MDDQFILFAFSNVPQVMVDRKNRQQEKHQIDQINAGFDRINTVIQDGNDVSIALSKKLGFEQKESYEIDGKIMHRFIKEFN